MTSMQVGQWITDASLILCVQLYVSWKGLKGLTIVTPGLHAGMISVGPTRVVVEATKAPMISSTKVL